MRMELIRRMDRALNEARGGFTTRAELISEAVEQLLVEISYEEAPPEPKRDGVASRRGGSPLPVASAEVAWEMPMRLSEGISRVAERRPAPPPSMTPLADLTDTVLMRFDL